MSQHALGPHVVGRRVVVRRVVRGETGPSGGPALTDVLGVCESWADGLVAVRRESGELVIFPSADVVSGKPVPPRPSPRLRVSAEEIHLRAMEGLRSRHVEHAGRWVLRATGGTTGRTNSALAVVDPGIGYDVALEQVDDFYARHHRAPMAQVMVGSDVHEELERRGWTRARPDEADPDVLLGSVAQVRRTLAPRLPADPPAVTLHSELPDDWFGTGQPPHLGFMFDLEVPVVFAEVRRDGEQRARGSATYSRDWTVVTNLRVHPDHRRQGLALLVMDALLGWAAEQGATTLSLQVLGDNRPALQLYESLGLERHHAYRYLTGPRTGPSPGRRR